MRVLFIGKRFYTNKDSLRDRFGRIYQLPLHWHKAGKSVSLALLDYRGTATEKSVRDGLQVRSLPVRDPRSIPRLRSQVLQFRPDVIIASGDCFVGLAALGLARSAGAGFVFDIYDDYREFAGYRIFLGWDAYGYLMRRADMLLYASAALATSDAPAVPWHLVPNGVDPACFRPADRTAARARSGLEPNLRWIGYFGGMDPDRGVVDLIDAVGMLHAHDQRVRLVLCGSARNDTPYNKPWVDYRGQVDHASIPDFINSCDVVVLPYRRGPLLDMAASCKIAEYLLCERPLVATQTPNFIENFPQQAKQLGPALSLPNDPVDLARAITAQLESPRIASRPQGHTWTSIGHETLVALERIVLPPLRHRARLT